MSGYGHIWTEEKVKSEILRCMDILGIDRMPTSTEIKNVGRMDLHNKISKTKKYSGWAEYLELSRKSSTTLMGQDHEEFTSGKLIELGHTVERMTTKHPYDLLVNDTVKVDVKSGKGYMMRGESRVHSFGINKKEPTCDIYIILAIGESNDIERTFIIPSHHLKVVHLCIGKDSKYNKFIDCWHYVEQYTTFHKIV